jgi:hypothetical protein
VHVGQVQVEQYDVIIIQLTQIEALFAQVGGVDIEPFGREHHLDGFDRGWLVLNQKHTHWEKTLFETLAPPKQHPRNR